MSNWHDHGPVTDGDLVAYLDGQLESGMADYVESEVKKERGLEARLELLRQGLRPFSNACDILLREAPETRLKNFLQNTLEPHSPSAQAQAREPEPEPEPEPEAEQEQELEPEPEIYSGPDRSESEDLRREAWGGWRKMAAALVLFAVFSAGFISSRFVTLPGEPSRQTQAPAPRGWRAAAAEYQALFVKETLAQASLDEEARSASLRTALSHVGLELAIARVSVAPLEFKRADVLNFKGKPLVQIAYLIHGDKPVSLCIIKSAKPAHDLKPERRAGLNIVHWHDKGHGYMIIGDVPGKELGAIARKLKRQIS